MDFASCHPSAPLARRIPPLSLPSLPASPLASGSELSGAQGPAPSSLYSKVVPICYMVAMAGCLCFFTHFRGRRRYGKGGPLRCAGRAVHSCVRLRATAFAAAILDKP